MASIKSVTLYSDVPWQNTGLRKKRFSVVLTDNDLIDHEILTRPERLTVADNGNALAQQLLENEKTRELSFENISTKWSDTQADYDRRALGRAMLLTDVDEFYSYLPLFKAMESRGGANRNQRAAYLGVSLANYTLMEKRFNDVEGIAFFLDNAKGQIWTELPPEFE